MKKRMARLMSLKRKDENRYRTFSNVSFAPSDDKLAFTTMSKPKKKTPVVAPAVHRNYEKRSQRPRKRKRWISWVFCSDRKWIWRVLCCPCFFCCYLCKRKARNANDEDDVDRAVEEFKQQQGVSGDGQSSQKSTLKSEKGASRFWNWDESWKSNSDKFLDSLELDCVGSDKSLERKLRQKNSKIRVTAFNRSGGGWWEYLSLAWQLWQIPIKWQQTHKILSLFHRRNSSLRQRELTCHRKQKCRCSSTRPSSR